PKVPNFRKGGSPAHFQKVLFLLAFLLLIFLPKSTAQTATLDQSLRQQITQEGKKVAWLRSFKGRLDDLNDVSVALAFDGEKCRGKLQYLRSKETFDLKGEAWGDQFWLDETDAEGKVTGYLEGKVKEYVFQGAWQNFDKTIAKTATLVEVKTLDDTPTACGNNKWIGKYATSSGDLELLLQKGANNQVWGIAFHQKRSFKVNGLLDDNLRLNLTLKKSGGSVLGNLAGDFRSDKDWSANFTQPGKAQQPLKFQVKDRLGVDCIEYADYSTSYDVTYPKTKNAAFNLWMEKKAASWISLWQTQVSRFANLERTPEQRAVGQASAWCEVEFFSEQIVSGFFTCQTTWSQQQQGMAFNFDLKKGEEIRQKDLFKDAFKPSIFVKNMVKTAFKNHSLYESDKDFRHWIETAEFPYFTIRKEGI
ncbi:MAG: hypothetical protein AAB316_18435, partial [Bacteroidota bacterium]